MNKLTRRHLAREVVRLCVAHPERQASLMQQLAAYLVAHKRTSELTQLSQDIADELFVQQKHLSAHVRSAFALQPASQQAIESYLKAATGARTVQLSNQLDPQLLGGIVLKTPRWQLDTSLRSKLKAITGETI